MIRAHIRFAGVLGLMLCSGGATVLAIVAWSEWGWAFLACVVIMARELSYCAEDVAEAERQERRDKFTKGDD